MMTSDQLIHILLIMIVNVNYITAVTTKNEFKNIKSQVKHRTTLWLVKQDYWSLQLSECY